MFALGIRYLNGFAAAARRENRERPEWPPHPGRVFMALAAAHFQSGAVLREREALIWLESLQAGAEPIAPSIVAAECSERAAVTHFVPVNDRAGPSKAPLQAVGLTRGRQPRIFARAWLEDDTVYLVWQDAEPNNDTRAALQQLCAKVTRIGHSASLVQMWLAEAAEVPSPTWEPAEDGAEIHLRVASKGTLDYLEQQFNSEEVERYCELKVTESDGANPKAQKAARKALRTEFPLDSPIQLRPQLSIYQGYARRSASGKAVPGSAFSPHLAVLRLKPKQSRYRSLDLCATLQVTQRWREAALSESNDLSQEARAILSGHDPSGTPLESPHLAFVPLAFVGSEHADGHLLGAALAVPEGIDPHTRRELMRAFGRVEELVLGNLGVWRLESVMESRPPTNLRASTWTGFPGGAERWATVTPIAFDRHSKASGGADSVADTSEMIRSSCEKIGLPVPREVILTPVSAHLGAPPSHEFPRLQRKDGSLRRHTHAILVFDEAVRGPVTLGAGRYRGYGLCRPLD